MKVTLVQHTPNPEEHIGLLAGICYGKTGEQSPEQCIKRATHCVTKGHLSTLRFAHLKRVQPRKQHKHTHH